MDKGTIAVARNRERFPRDSGAKIQRKRSRIASKEGPIPRNTCPSFIHSSEITIPRVPFASRRPNAEQFTMPLRRLSGKRAMLSREPGNSPLQGSLNRMCQTRDLSRVNNLPPTLPANSDTSVERCC